MREVLRVIRKRWYVTLPIVLITIALSAVANTVLPTTYQSQCSISLLNSPDVAAQAPNNGNPFLTFSQALTVTADFLGRRLSSDESAKELKARGLTGEYGVKLADNAMGPFLTLTVTGPNPAQVEKSIAVLNTYAADQLKAIQAEQKAPAGSQIASTVIVPPQAPQAQTKTKLQSVALIALGGLAVAFLSGFVAENLAGVLQRRRARSRKHGSAAADTDDEAPGQQAEPSLAAGR
ncbi:chain length determinant protein [Kitasatospora sp. GP82]|uniref:chain length determinant protein n=1 Tax=Kitasatospora sp. GP82 TaxID=3035089 RepID=UPI0024736840|nr:chain length determinant protein [Kitasatospora sp. GP82]